MGWGSNQDWGSIRADTVNKIQSKNYSIFTWPPELNEKFQNAIFLRFFKFLQLGNSNRSKNDQKNFFENISKTTGAAVVQNFGILDGAADLPVEI